MRGRPPERIAAKCWRGQNRRRLELIAKKLQSPLATAEEEEFQQLQTRAYEQAAPFDGFLLQTAANLTARVGATAGGTGLVELASRHRL